jgi:hypothetical protein
MNDETKDWILCCLRELTEEYGFNCHFPAERIAEKASLPIEELGDFRNETGPLWELYHDDHLISYAGDSRQGFSFAARGSIEWGD